MSAKTIYKKIGELIEKSPKLIVLLAIVLMFVSLYGAGMIEHKSGTDTFVKKDSETYQNYDHLYKQNFGSEVIVVLVESDKVLNAEVLRAIDNFELIIQRDKDVESTMSMATLIKSASYSATGRSEIPGDDTIDSLRGYLPEAYAGQLMPDEQHAIIMIQMTGNIDETNKKRLLAEVGRTLEVSPCQKYKYYFP